MSRPVPPRRPQRPAPRPAPRPRGDDSGFVGGPAFWLITVLALGASGLLFFDLSQRREPPPAPVAQAPTAPAEPKAPPAPPREAITGSVLGEVAPAPAAKEEPPKVAEAPALPVYEPDGFDPSLLRRYKTVSTRLTEARLGDKDRLSKAAKAAHELRANPREPLTAQRGDPAWVSRIRGVVEAYWADIDPDRCVPHPDAYLFPGAVQPGADRVIWAVQVPLDTPRRHSTGLYAAPGERITFRMPSGDLDKGFVARIGCHSDNLLGTKRDAWRRWPVLTNAKALDKREVEMANPFGGPIYIEIPGREEWARTRERVRVEIKGAVEAPFFELGKTTKAEWENRRLAPAPWGELVGANMVLSVPSEHLRKLEYPENLMRVWDKVVETGDWLAALPRRRSPERIVADAEISIGWMHSGYPIMCYLESAPDMVSLRHLLTQGNWGFYHELGHNRQSSLWTYSGYTEVTCNLFSLICMERISGQKVGGGHSDLAALADEMALDPKAHAGSAFHLLAQYYHPIAAFGWEPLQATFAELGRRKDIRKADGMVSRTNNRAGRAANKAVEALEDEKADLEKQIRALDKKLREPKPGEREKAVARLAEIPELIKKAGEALGALAKEDSDEKKKEIFVKIWSKHTGHDLGPYFATFGWPHTDHMKAFNKGLKPWMPKDFPPKPAKAAAAPRAKSTLFGSRNEAMAGTDEVHGDDNPANDH